MLALLYKRIYTNKKAFSTFLAQCLLCIGFVWFISVRRQSGVPKVWQLSYFSNNSMSNESKVDCFIILLSPNKMIQHSNLPLKVAYDTPGR